MTPWNPDMSAAPRDGTWVRLKLLDVFGQWESDAKQYRAAWWRIVDGKTVRIRAQPIAWRPA